MDTTFKLLKKNWSTYMYKCLSEGADVKIGAPKRGKNEFLFW